MSRLHCLDCSAKRLERHLGDTGAALDDGLGQRGASLGGSAWKGAVTIFVCMSSASRALASKRSFAVADSYPLPRSALGSRPRGTPSSAPGRACRRGSSSASPPTRRPAGRQTPARRESPISAAASPPPSARPGPGSASAPAGAFSSTAAEFDADRRHLRGRPLEPVRPRGLPDGGEASIRLRLLPEAYSVPERTRRTRCCQPFVTESHVRVIPRSPCGAGG